MRGDDLVRVRHMIEASQRIGEFLSKRVRADLDTDAMLLFAVVRAIEIIGEAASRLTDETRAAASAIPWKAIVGMRNRIIHAYFDVDTDIVWKAATEEIPALKQKLLALIGAEPKGG